MCCFYISSYKFITRIREIAAWVRYLMLLNRQAVEKEVMIFSHGYYPIELFFCYLRYNAVYKMWCFNYLYWSCRQLISWWNERKAYRFAKRRNNDTLIGNSRKWHSGTGDRYKNNIRPYTKKQRTPKFYFSREYGKKRWENCLCSRTWYLYVGNRGNGFWVNW